MGTPARPWKTSSRASTRQVAATTSRKGLRCLRSSTPPLPSSTLSARATRRLRTRAGERGRRVPRAARRGLEEHGSACRVECPSREQHRKRLNLAHGESCTPPLSKDCDARSWPSQCEGDVVLRSSSGDVGTAVWKNKK